MRWKLLSLTSLVAALISAGTLLAFLYWMNGFTQPLRGHSLSVPGTLMIGMVVIPLMIFTAAAIFVYRHTARRRKLQALTTVLLSIILTLSVLRIAQTLLRRPSEVAPTAPATKQHRAP